MVEIDRRLSGSEFPKLVVPETKKITNEDIGRMFGDNYRQLIERKAAQFGITGLQFFDAPRPHDGSQAVYLVEQLVGDHLILVPVLEPNMRTSRHCHEAPMAVERYLHIAGESFVSIDDKELPLNSEQNLIEVPLGVFHQVRTQESPSLALIIMENARLVPPGRLHVKLP